jgi:hypothetical protein
MEKGTDHIVLGTIKVQYCAQYGNYSTVQEMHKISLNISCRLYSGILFLIFFVSSQIF